MKKKLRIGAICMAVILTFTFVLSACAKKPTNAPSSVGGPHKEAAVSANGLTAQRQTNGNNINGPRLLEVDDMLYYFMPDGVHRLREDGSENVLIYEIPRAEGEQVSYNGGTLAAAGDWIYIRERDVLRVKTDGTGLEPILDELKQSGTLTAVDDWLYIGSNYKLKLDGSEFQQFYDGKAAAGYTFNIADGWIYRYDQDENGEDCIYKFKPDGTQKKKIHSGRADFMIVDGEWIYYAELFGDNSIYKMKTDGSENELVLPLEQRVKTLNLMDEWLYYGAYGEDKRCYLCRVKTDGTDNQMLYTNENDEGFNISEIYILGEWVYVVDKESNLYRIAPDGTDAQLIAEWTK